MAGLGDQIQTRESEGEEDIRGDHTSRMQDSAQTNLARLLLKPGKAKTHTEPKS